MKRCRTCDQHAVDPMLNGLCCDCAIAAQQASTGAAPMSREQDSVAVQGSPEWYVDELRTLAYNITGRGVGICNGAALTIEKLYRLTREAAPQASGGDGWQRMTDEARAIQLRHLDNHQGDVYHAMQHLAVCFGYRDTRPLTQPIATTDSAQPSSDSTLRFVDIIMTQGSWPMRYAIQSQQGGAEGDA